MAIFRLLPLVAVTGMLLSGCEPSSQQLSLSFTATAGGNPLHCQGRYQGGKNNTAFSLRDLRFFISDISLIRADGHLEPLTLIADGKWQYGSVALLDFEDGRDHCAGNSGNPDTNHQVVGTIPAGTYTGIEFTLGVPPQYNHLGETSAVGKSPLKTNGMKWSWEAGHKFARFDIAPEGGVDYIGQDGSPARSRAWLFHLGATDCEGDLKTETAQCSRGNLPRIRLENFNPLKDRINLDYSQLVEGLTLNNDTGGRMGCMSGVDDPECKPMFAALGLTLASGRMDGAQALFHVLPSADLSHRQ